jgi:hypothetical protein
MKLSDRLTADPRPQGETSWKAFETMRLSARHGRQFKDRPINRHALAAM